MSVPAKITLLLLLAGAVVITVYFRPKDAPSAAVLTASSTDAAPSSQPGARATPKLLCLGAGKCIPCKAMEPIREELRKEYDGRLTVEFHDVWKDPARAEQFGVRMIPTTIFYDADGKELERTEGFIGKADILARFARHGIEFSTGGPS